MFVQRIDPLTGELQWIVEDEENYDMAQELARSRFADMILDYDRNDKFEAGLKTVINEIKGKGKKVHVLDIGTGTGLLSMMAARAGADKVTAVEVFEPMAKCAQDIIETTQWKDTITIHSTRSTDITELGGDKPNVIVAEVFDTELNGEGALRTFKDALTNLVEPGCRVIPSLGRVWILPVASHFLSMFNRIPIVHSNQDNEQGDNPGPFGYCRGTSSVFDLQLSQLQPNEHFTPLGEPIVAFSFDFESADSIVFDESFIREFTCNTSGRIDAIMMWWDLDMDRTGSNWIDMAPTWRNPQFAWRDHWMQGVYYLPNNINLKKGEKISIVCSHDEYSMWFTSNDSDISRPYCRCKLHSILSRQSLYRLNSLLENDKFTQELNKICSEKSVVVVSDGSLLGLMIAKIAKNVTIVEGNQHFRSVLLSYAMHHGYSNLRFHSSIEQVVSKPDIILGEPIYLSSMNPWDNLRFWYDVERIKNKFPGEHIDIWPKEGILYAQCEQFHHLHTISSPVGTVSGFNLSRFDDLSQKARQATDALVDEQPLWEYGGMMKGKKTEVMRFNLTEERKDIRKTIILDKSSANGIPLWIEWSFGDYILSSGITGMKTTEFGEEPEWSVSYKQGVYFIPPHLLGEDKLSLTATYSMEDGTVNFRFK